MTRKQKQIKMRRVIAKLHEKKYIHLIDRQIKECIQKGENYDVEYKGKIMTLTPEDLKTKCTDRQYIEKPKFGEKPYHIYGYLWEPTKSVNNGEQ